MMSCYPARVPIVQKPIVWDSTRVQLSLQYLHERHGLDAHTPNIDPRMIVVHWTAIPTFEGSYRAFYPSVLPGRPQLQAASSLNVGIHFLVDQDGTVYQLLPENYFARHVIGLNYCALGIENVGDNADHPLTEAQLRANIRLIKYLLRKYPEVKYVIGHHEYREFAGTPLYKETNPDYFTEKIDPGDAFLEAIYRHLPKNRVMRRYEVKS
ncbi:MAG: N-acetylmuramoyl-L-alanine amidase [Lewinellaceae bacterium]|nr:N-acetylmuramoyl-L-alanine amidase [Lewinellaceae bacterium]